MIEHEKETYFRVSSFLSDRLVISRPLSSSKVDHITSSAQSRTLDSKAIGHPSYKARAVIRCYQTSKSLQTSLIREKQNRDFEL